MAWQPHRIVLISPSGRYSEAPGNADVYPGQILATQTDGGVIPYGVSGGAESLKVAIEDALQGNDITQKYPSGQIVRFWRPVKSDVLLFLLAIGENVTHGQQLMNDGLGSLKAYPATIGGAELYEILAPSTTITNVGTETTFSNGSYAMPANTLKVGDDLKIHFKAFCIAENSTNTHRVRLYVNATTLVDSAALQLAANDVVIGDITLTVRTIGASGTFIADGQMETSVGGTFTVTPITIASTALDTTAIATFAIKSLASATNAGNQIRLDEYRVLLDRAGLSVQIPIVQAGEALDNSAGSAPAFIRGTVI